MRTLFIIPLVLMSLVSFPSWGLTMDDLVDEKVFITNNLLMFLSLVRSKRD